MAPTAAPAIRTDEFVAGKGSGRVRVLWLAGQTNATLSSGRVSATEEQSGDEKSTEVKQTPEEVAEEELTVLLRVGWSLDAPAPARAWKPVVLAGFFKGNAVFGALALGEDSVTRLRPGGTASIDGFDSLV